jgi:cbb3-type cytochrome oxidase maturation protein
MEILFILVPVSLALSIAALLTFLWTLRSAQYDDLDGAAWRILLDGDMDPEIPAADQDDGTPHVKPFNQDETKAEKDD